MDDIQGFLRKNYTPRITEDKQGVKVIFKGRGNVLEDGVVWFQPAKKGWNKKPITQRNKYIIVDADTGGMLDVLNKYLSLDESHYPTVRRELINYAMETVEEHFSRGEEWTPFIYNIKQAGVYPLRVKTRTLCPPIKGVNQHNKVTEKIPHIQLVC